jgi:conjugal transfer pilus assembly protein TraA
MTSAVLLPADLVLPLYSFRPNSVGAKPLKDETMNLKDKLVGRAGDVALAAAAVVAATAAAHAGADTTFSTTVTTLQGWAEGSLGKMAAVGGIAVALVGLIAKFDWRLIGGAIGIGLTAATGPAIVSGLATAIF